MQIFIGITLFIGYFSIIESSHFSGGTINWKPINNKDVSPQISVLITQSYQWRLSSEFCNESYVLNKTPLIPRASGHLICIPTINNSCGGYSTIPTDGYCTDFSSTADSSSSQISAARYITSGSKFCVAYRSGNWVAIQMNNCGMTSGPSICTNNAASWSIGTCIDLSLRLDGVINTSPVATIISPIKVPINTVTHIKVPIVDVDNDFLRCRWAQNSSHFDECYDVCGVVPGSTLHSDNCTLTFNSTGRNPGDYYVAALMIEDFYTNLTAIPFSSVPLQFLILIVVPPACPKKPTISSNLSACTAVEVGIQFNFTLRVEQGCPGTNIIDYYRIPPLNMYKSAIGSVGSTVIWSITETWVPTIEQLGSQVYCAVATDSANIQSNQYCTTFTVVPVGQTLICPSDIPANRTTTLSTSSSTTLHTSNSSILTSASVTATSATATISRDSISTISRTVPIAPTPTTKISQTNNWGFQLGLGVGLGVPALILLICLAVCCCYNFFGLFGATHHNRPPSKYDEHNERNAFDSNKHTFLRNTQLSKIGISNAPLKHPDMMNSHS